MSQRGKIRALVVDDTAFMRRAIVEILSRDAEIEVVGVARHGREALDAIPLLDPDVLTLDVDMPVMDGLTAMKHIMVRYPRPVVMVSGLVHQSAVTMHALRLGAFDFFPKPSGTISLDIHEQADDLQQVVKAAARVEPCMIRRARIGHAKKAKGAREQHASGLVIVIARKGSSCDLIRMLSMIDGQSPFAVLVHHEISSDVLRSYVEGIGASLPMEARVGDVVGSPWESECIFMPWGRFPRIEQKEGVFGVGERVFDDAEDYASDLLDRKIKGSLLVHLGAGEPAFLSSDHSHKGMRVFDFSSPVFDGGYSVSCPFSGERRSGVKVKVEDAVESIKKFGRRLYLESHGRLRGTVSSMQG